MEPLTTDRLHLRPFTPEDREPFAAMSADPTVMAHFPKTLTRAESDVLIDAFEAKAARDGFCFSAVTTKTGTFLGMCGLNRPGFAAPFMPCVEIGWRLRRAAWGQGFATEAARAWLAFGFETLALPEIVAFTSPLNTPSCGVMERLGMTRDHSSDFKHPNLPASHRLSDHVLYRQISPHYDA